jgi:benzoyl-CoA reductase subunit A
MKSWKIYVGIDLGSTTTKAVILDENERVLGKGITNSRSNYDVAAAIARSEAFVQARFTLLHSFVQEHEALAKVTDEVLPVLELNFRFQQYLEQLGRLQVELHNAARSSRHANHREDLEKRVDQIVDEMATRMRAAFVPGSERKSDFFRDLAGAEYMKLAEEHSATNGIGFEELCSLYDAAILPVENTTGKTGFVENIQSALASTVAHLANDPEWSSLVESELRSCVNEGVQAQLEEIATVGTGYGRARLPFPREQIRSEILCHGLGAHSMFPGTATVLDIGGQDTKAIQVDENGIVTSFQMNDRCAAGCGRYLGYIADEMNLGLHELGPLAQQARKKVKISSTCTVFAGAELRDRLSMGQRREDILGGLHRAIILRAMSLLARSGGIENEFTFTGGVARNPAAVAAVERLIEENYGERTINISPDSIYTGALGAALFAKKGGSDAHEFDSN